jgi:tRNA (Thr-GGU) A37 N-methylase
VLYAFGGTPLLDLKPFIPKFDRVEDAGGGWLGGQNGEK